MGLTGGFADVGGLYDCLHGIYAGLADDSILDKYDEVQRERYNTVIDPISSGNIRRLWDPSIMTKVQLKRDWEISAPVQRRKQHKATSQTSNIRHQTSHLGKLRSLDNFMTVKCKASSVFPYDVFRDVMCCAVLFQTLGSARHL